MASILRRGIPWLRGRRRRTFQDDDVEAQFIVWDFDGGTASSNQYIVWDSGGTNQYIVWGSSL